MSRAPFLFIVIYCLFGSIQASSHLIRCTRNDIGLRFSHPRSCSLFVVCTSEQKIDIRNCPQGLHFNQREQVCDLPQRANCMKQSTEAVELCDLCDCNVCCANCEITQTTSIATTTESLTTVISGSSMVTVGLTEGTTISYTEELTTTSESPETLTTLGPCGCTAEISTKNDVEAETTTSKASTTTTSKSSEPLTTAGPCGCTAETTTKDISAFETTSKASTTTTTVSAEPPATSGTCGCTAESNTASTPNFEPTLEVSIATTTQSPESLATVQSSSEYSSEFTTTSTACGCTGEKSSEPDLPEPSITTFCSTVKPIENCDEACCGQRNGATFAYEGDCQSFLICLGQRQTVMKCPNNLHFSISSGSCDFPQNANCQWSYMPPSGPAAGPSGTHCNYGGRCVGQSDGTTFAHETDLCSSEYAVCQCECEVLRNCSAPLMFNPKNNVCDWPKNLGCQ